MIVYVAYGNKARKEVIESIRTLRKYNDFPVTIIRDTPLEVEDVTYVKFNDPKWAARWAKLNIPNLVEADTIGYLDADTRVHGNLQPAFDIIEQGWDIALSYSINQDSNTLKHIEEKERTNTLAMLSNPFPLQLQCGVMFFNRQKCIRLFESWRSEWLKYEMKDQAAFLRALEVTPVKIALLGRPWNGGSIVEHLFGRAHG